MKLRDFALLTDQNIHPDVISWLRTESFDVLEMDQAGLIGMPDESVLVRAVAENRVVVTHDADFGSLAVPQGSAYIGLLYLRPGHVGAQPTIDSIRILLDSDPDLVIPFIAVVKRNKNGVAMRIRQSSP